MSPSKLTAYTSHFWRQTIFKWVLSGCAFFVLGTTLAMLLYPGGTRANPSLQSYSFLGNFFSDTGRTISFNGKTNPLGSASFAAGLALGGLALIGFFLGFRQFFGRQPWLSSVAAGAGIGAGLGFIGVALTPANVAGPLHGDFVLWAFRLFTLAALLFGVAIYREKSFPRWLGFIFVAFTAILVGYLRLLTKGPGLDTPHGILVQVVGQKIIAYASVLTVAIESVGVLRLHPVTPPEDQ